MRRPSVPVWREGVTSQPDTYLGPAGPAILHMMTCSKPRWCPPEHVTGVCVCVSERVVTDRVNSFSSNALILLEGWIYITKLALGEEPIEWSDPGVDTLSLFLIGELDYANSTFESWCRYTNDGSYVLMLLLSILFLSYFSCNVVSFELEYLQMSSMFLMFLHV